MIPQRSKPSTNDRRRIYLLQLMAQGLYRFDTNLSEEALSWLVMFSIAKEIARFALRTNLRLCNMMQMQGLRLLEAVDSLKVIRLK